MQQRKINGVVLLHVLMLLVVITSLVIIVLSTAKKNVEEVSALQDKLSLQLKTESLIKIIASDLAKSGTNARWLKAKSPYQIIFDKTEFSVSINNSQGLVDINTADILTVERLFANKLEPHIAAHCVQKVKSARKSSVSFGIYADVAHYLGLPFSQLDQLQPYVTLFSRLEHPSYQYSPDELRKVLHLESIEQKKSAMSDEHVSYGQTYKIFISTINFKMIVEILITGNINTPYVIRELM